MLAAYIVLMLILVLTGYFLGRRSGFALYRTAGSVRNAVHSLPSYHGWLTATFTFFPMVLALVAWTTLAPGISKSAAIGAAPVKELAVDPARRLLEEQALYRDVQVAANLLKQGQPLTRPELQPAAEAFMASQSRLSWALIIFGALGGAAGIALGLKRIKPAFRSRNAFEQIVMSVLIACSAVAVLTTVGIVFSVLYETLHFASVYPFWSFLTGTVWSPSSLTLGALPLFVGTILITLVAIAIAGPVGLFAAIYMSEYASQNVRNFVKPILEVLAGIPTVVFGFFAALTIAPMFKGMGDWIDLNLGTNLGVASESALAAGLVMGVMIIPFVSSLSDDVINAVPQSLRDGSFGMGATKSETIKKVVLPAALPGIVSAFMLAISRAVGETMIVVMAAGLAGNLTWNPLEAVTTITVQIKTLLVGDQEFNSPKTLSAFALGFVLFFFTLTLNMIALRIVRKYREQYD
ncbi:MAG: phosphate ABC transporter permease subunit PstC [Methylocystis sp.]|jgi:phosphate transport system permease protein|nr:phosphate ABC transporter permease subunit PstC [Methylocystis sp.]MCA3583609.1 phosphate ABC transporter permease subunit PstC [Methylocystis sp.]MCA3586545.1 phosphate ABC transporter permease subunit PstC [Methylocystis sp.]MCA3593304.1 phosphate ABC transporter permease subunit PstC [Methylocystis sp.]